jgi:hypothetical protein
MIITIQNLANTNEKVLIPQLMRHKHFFLAKNVKILRDPLNAFRAHISSSNGSTYPPSFWINQT